MYCLNYLDPRQTGCLLHEISVVLMYGISVLQLHFGPLRSVTEGMSSMLLGPRCSEVPEETDTEYLYTFAKIS